MENDAIELGKSGVRVSPLGTGTWSWGDDFYWGYGSGYGENDVHQAFDESLRAGIDFFDTAEMYGFGKSEKFIGEFLRAARASNPSIADDLHIATKYAPLPWRLTRGQVVRALRASLKRLGLATVDLYQIHWDMPWARVDSMMDGLADAVEQKLTRAVGVSNYNAARVRRAHGRLASRGVPLATNQIQYNLLSRGPDFDGTMETCRALGVTVIAYSPIKYGVLSGKYTPANPPPGMRGRQFNPAYLKKVEPLIDTVRAVAAKYDKTLAQVAIRWVIQRDALPIPGAKNLKQARENAGALGWTLAPDDMELLNQESERIHRL